MTSFSSSPAGPTNNMAGIFFLILVTLLKSITGNPTILPEDSLDYVTDASFDYSNVTKNSTDPSANDAPSGSDTISIMWYLVSFAGLVTFFLLLSFSEFCCKKTPPLTGRANGITDSQFMEAPAPPPYELFAPPTYDSLFRDIVNERKRSISLFLVPVHDKAEIPRESPLQFGEVIRRNPMGDGEVVTPPPPP